jgi:hypothetical protein
VIQDERDATRYGRYEVLGSTSRADPPEVGELLQLEPCVEIPWPDRRASEERPCPRVALDPENVEAMELLRLSVSEISRPMAGPLSMALPPRTRRRVILRVHNAIHAPTVMDGLFPQRKKDR